MNDLVSLSPGEVYFGSAPTVIKTLLGSCVALVVWHKRLQVGGMCHYLIAEESNKAKINKKAFKYGTNSLEYLQQTMMSYANIEEFEFSLFGGSNMYKNSRSPTIGEHNVSYAKNWLKQKNITLKEDDTLGNIGRSITLDLSTGSVTTIHYEPLEKGNV